MPGEVLEYSVAQPVEKQLTVPPSVVRVRVEPPPPVQARQGYKAWNEEAAHRKCQEEEDVIKRQWQTFEEEDPELFAKVRRRGLCPTNVSGLPTPRGMITGTSLRTMGVQCGRCPRKEGNVTLPAPHDQQTAKRRTRSAEEWIKDPNGILERMTKPNGNAYIRYVSTSSPGSEQDDA